MERTILTEYVDGIRSGWTDDEVHRFLLHGIPRYFHNADDTARRTMLRVKPDITNTKWDALVAAVVEHVAGLHGHEPPKWVDEPERFNSPPVNFASLFASNAITCCPAAFLRHGALADPAELDARGGEHVRWVREADI